ncbi:MAG: hypothetical protein K5686_13425 [Lachnospiraceae bacterium]|nr:hypothetical protein [Lachnospiraceae bacterium]
MKTDNALFHKGAFKEASKQLALPVILATFVMIIGQVLFSLVVENENPYRQVVSLRFISVPAAVVFLLVTPAMILYVSQYMMKRSAGDMYAAFPVKKESLVFSDLLSVLMYSAVMMIIGIITAEIMTAFSKTVSLGVNDWYMVLGEYIAAAIYMSGAMYLALSVTGNHFATLSAFLMLILAPRVIVTSWLGLISMANHTIDNLFEAGIFDDRLNAVTAFITGPLLHDSFGNISLKSIVYTLCVGLIYCFLAILAHKKRPSETAGYAAVSEKWQAVLRTIPACLVSIVPIALIMDDNETAGRAEGLYIVIMFYLLVILVYFAYELFTTRKLKETLKKAPGLLIVVLFNIIFAGSVVAGQKLIAKDFPDAASAGDISICLNGYRYYRTSVDKDYYAVKMKEYAIKDPEAKELLCNSLRLYQQIYNSNENPIRVGMSLKFSSGTMFKNREFEMLEGDWNKLLGILEKDPSFKAIFTQPIPESDVKSITANMFTGTEDFEYSDYSALLSELSGKDFNSVVKSLTSVGSAIDYPGYEITTKDGLVQNVCITPETPDLYMDHMNSHADKALLSSVLKDWEEDAKYVKSTEPGGVTTKGLSVIFYNLPEGKAHNEYVTDYERYFSWGIYKDLAGPDDYESRDDDKRTKEYIKELNSLLTEQSDSTIRDISAPYVKILYRVCYDTVEGVKILEEKTAYMAVDPVTADWAVKINNEINY